MQNDYKPFHCRCCRRSLAITNGARLLIGEAYTDEPITLRCAGCGLRQTWKPIGLDKVDTEAYTRFQPA
jgi:RNase P subunit RPR2